MLGLAAEQGVRPVLTNAVRYADPGQGPVADVLDSARRLMPVDPRRGFDGGERWLKGAEEMARAAEEIAEAAGFGRGTARRLLEVTEETAAACRVDPQDDLGVGTVHFPEPRLVGADRRSAERVLRSRCAAGMVLKGYDRDETRWRRLDHELRIIEQLGFASYFLTVARVVDDTRDLGIRVTARGSGAGSLVNHLLGIAAADPVEHNLLMERFLSTERAALPDIDVDVESARRLEVYRAIFDRFGAERVATVAMPETYRVRHAVRDVGAALGMDPAEVDRLAKAFPHIRARDARAALAELPELRHVDAERYGPRMWDLVEALDGLPRGVAMHPCGVLLSDDSLRARTPVVPTSGEGFAMSQFDKDDVEELGLLKLDVLGVRMQSSMAHALDEIERATGERIDLDAVPAGRSAHLRADPRGGDAGLLPDRVTRPAGSGGPAAAARLPRPCRGHLAVPARPGRRRHGPPVHRGTARPPRAALPAPGPGAGAARDVRGGRLPRAAHRDPVGDDGLRPLTGGRGAARAGSAGGAAAPEGVVRAGGCRTRLSAGGDRAHLGDRRGVRRVRVLQGARGGVRGADVPVGVAEGAPPGGVLRGAAGARSGDVPEAAAAGGRAAARGADPAVGREPLGGRLSNRTGVRKRRVGAPVGAVRGAGRQRGRGGADRRRPALRFAA